ncbi:hypothetical protein FQN57_000994 [Myotisia sp. PD_48]|nr:hypothetical protein FQN57_000994 [Myotisia sp. PD_48]
MEEDPELIAILVPHDEHGLAEHSFSLPENQARCLPPSQWILGNAKSFSRESTPASQPEEDHDSTGPEQPPENIPQQHEKHRIKLKLNDPLKNPSRGFVFGTDPSVCDVLLKNGETEAYISRAHFSITFNAGRYLVLKDFSTRGTAVSYDGQAENERRRRFTWIINLPDGNGALSNVKVHIRNLSFKVQLANHTVYGGEYTANVERFLEEAREALPQIDRLAMDSYSTPVRSSQPLTPRQNPVYISQKRLGNGSFGEVDLVIDASTAAIYARKKFFDQTRKVKQKPKRTLESPWLIDEIWKEIRIMLQNPHEFVMPIVHYQISPPPCLVMPYFPIGNLDDLCGEKGISDEQTVIILHQALQALEHLHSRGVVHRDLKPENILVASCHPLKIVLADFGHANDKLNLKTLCGTRTYIAPEVVFGGHYTSSVDIWSLAVVGLKCAYGLPEGLPKKQGNHPKLSVWVDSWSACLVEFANDLASDTLIDYLTSSMLRIDPDERLPAAACRRKGEEIGLFDDLDSGQKCPATSQHQHTGSDVEGFPKEVRDYTGPIPPRSNKRRRLSAHISTRVLSTIKENQEDFSKNLLVPSTIKQNQHDIPQSLLVPSTIKQNRQDISKNLLVPSANSTSEVYFSIYQTIHELLLDVLPVGTTINSDINVLISDLWIDLVRRNITELVFDSQGNITAMLNSERTIVAALTASEMSNSASDLVNHIRHMLQLKWPESQHLSPPSHLSQLTDYFAREEAANEIESGKLHPKIDQVATADIVASPAKNATSSGRIASGSDSESTIKLPTAIAESPGDVPPIPDSASEWLRARLNSEFYKAEVEEYSKLVGLTLGANNTALGICYAIFNLFSL